MVGRGLSPRGKGMEAGDATEDAPGGVRWNPAVRQAARPTQVGGLMHLQSSQEMAAVLAEERAKVKCHGAHQGACARSRFFWDTGLSFFCNFFENLVGH